MKTKEEVYNALINFDFSSRYIREYVPYESSWYLGDDDEDELSGEDMALLVREKQARSLISGTSNTAEMARMIDNMYSMARQHKKDLLWGSEYEDGLTERIRTVGPATAQGMLLACLGDDKPLARSVRAMLRKNAKKPDYLIMDRDHDKPTSSHGARRLREVFAEEGNACWAVLELMNNKPGSILEARMPTGPGENTWYKLKEVRYPVSALCMDAKERQRLVSEALKDYWRSYRLEHYKSLVLGKPEDFQQGNEWKAKNDLKCLVYDREAIRELGLLQDMDDLERRGKVDFDKLRITLTKILRDLKEVEESWKEKAPLYKNGDKLSMAREVMRVVCSERAPLYAAQDMREGIAKLAKAALEYVITDADIYAFRGW